MPRMGAAFWLPFFWRGKSGAVGCLLRVLLHPRSNADPTTSDPSAFPASPCCPLALGLGCGMGMVLALLFFLCFVSGFYELPTGLRRGAARCLCSSSVFLQHTAAGLWALLGSSAPWGKLPSLVQDGSGVTTTPPERFRDYSGIPRAGSSPAAVPRGEGTSPPSCLALPGLRAKQGLSSWDGARENQQGLNQILCGCSFWRGLPQKPPGSRVAGVGRPSLPAPCSASP